MCIPITVTAIKINQILQALSAAYGHSLGYFFRYITVSLLRSGSQHFSFVDRCCLLSFWGEAPKRRLWRMKWGTERKKQGAVPTLQGRQCDYVSEGVFCVSRDGGLCEMFRNPQSLPCGKSGSLQRELLSFLSDSEESFSGSLFGFLRSFTCVQDDIFVSTLCRERSWLFTDREIIKIS